MIRTEAKSLSSSSPNNIQLHKWKAPIQFQMLKRKKQTSKKHIK